MTKFYSKTTGGFYSSEIHNVMPADAKQISDVLYRELMADQSLGKKIVSDENGNPQSVDFVPSAEYLKSLLKIEAKAALDKSDITLIRDCLEAGISVPQAWIGYRLKLRNIINGTDTISTELPTVPSYP